MFDTNKNNQINKNISLFQNTFNTTSIKIAIVLLFLFIPRTIFAYVGPGAGITFLGALWAVITAIVLAIGGFLVWPIRAFIRRRKIRKQENSPNDNASGADSKK